MSKLIIGENIVKSYGVDKEKRNVLDHVTVSIQEGEFVSVMGPSGSGKTTLMYALSGMDDMDQGKISLDGEDLTSLSDNELADIRRTKMGFVFQQPTMLKNLNILDNIILPSMRDNKKNASTIIKRARTLMKKVGISELENRDITKVSGGQLQRAGICRALMNNPRIIFGDEPTGALNSKSAMEIMDTFAEINKEGTTIMLVTHDASVAARTERILFMRDGTLVSELKLTKYDGTELEGRINEVMVKMQEIGI